MKIKIKDAKTTSLRFLSKLGFSKEKAELITENIIEAELVEKKSHGLIRLPSIKKQIELGKLKVQGDYSIISETSNSLHISADYQAGWYPIYKSLEKSIPKAKKSNIVSVGLKNLAYASGYIGAYARKAAENDLIFIGFNNSPGGLVPFGTKKQLWGTNPITIGVPTNDIPVILDMASSKITFGSLIVARNQGKPIKEGVAIDKEGNPTRDAVKVIDSGGILPIAEHKGSRLALIVELLAGALTGSRVGYAVPGGWGSFYILINPTMFRPLADFKNDVEKALQELKQNPKAEGFSEIYFPYEKSYKTREANLKRGEIVVDDKLYQEIIT